ncbi:hypothetical protein [Colwellia chukchiensis]|uniref:hypothetical protein n=1 Tax=Colwellia chukchiensis TaxID=641665 RepID=UPI001301EA83|nr:hypothetical protein [Colwellia chukchiensis]
MAATSLNIASAIAIFNTMCSQYTVCPEHRSFFTAMCSQHTDQTEHKKAPQLRGDIIEK